MICKCKIFCRKNDELKGMTNKLDKSSFEFQGKIYEDQRPDSTTADSRRSYLLHA